MGESQLEYPFSFSLQAFLPSIAGGSCNSELIHYYSQETIVQLCRHPAKNESKRSSWHKEPPTCSRYSFDRRICVRLIRAAQICSLPGISPELVANLSHCLDQGIFLTSVFFVPSSTAISNHLCDASSIPYVCNDIHILRMQHVVFHKTPSPSSSFIACTSLPFVASTKLSLLHPKLLCNLFPIHDSST